jgi:hypothetical protein
MPYQNPEPGGHKIPLALGVEMTRRYRSNMEQILAPDYQNREILAVCETFSLDVLQGLQNVKGAAAFRIYYGMSEDLKVHAILVAVDAEGKDILPNESPAANTEEEDPTGVLYEDSVRCPTYCPPKSELNTP